MQLTRGLLLGVYQMSKSVSVSKKCTVNLHFVFLYGTLCLTKGLIGLTHALLELGQQAPKDV